MLRRKLVTSETTIEELKEQLLQAKKRLTTQTSTNETKQNCLHDAYRQPPYKNRSTSRVQPATNDDQDSDTDISNPYQPRLVLESMTTTTHYVPTQKVESPAIRAVYDPKSVHPSDEPPTTHQKRSAQDLYHTTGMYLRPTTASMPDFVHTNPNACVLPPGTIYPTLDLFSLPDPPTKRRINKNPKSTEKAKRQTA